ncbi:MAG: ComF family protein [Candidatus Edwardsbacteria bacterium]
MKKTLFSLFRQWGKDFVNFLFPAECSVCHNFLKEGEKIICEKCWNLVRKVEAPWCSICGRPLKKEEEREICLLCEELPPLFTQARAGGIFEGTLAEAVHLLKYKRRISLAKRLAEMMAKSISASPLYRAADFLVSVPLHPSRIRERGYNQSDLLTEQLSSLLGIGWSKKILYRKKATASQTKLKVEERRENVKGAFAVYPVRNSLRCLSSWQISNGVKDKESLVGKKVILVDDVMTTGATINACAEVLRESGAKEVLALTAAVACTN